MSPSLNHVAVLVRSVAVAASVCEQAGYALGPVEDFPSEGTRELYVGPSGDLGRLLLMEAVGPGPYRRALEKRGSGLHHVAVDVDSIDDYVASLNGTGWLLHPRSLHTLAHLQTIYLARPGLHALIEVAERDKQSQVATASFITEVAIEGAREHEALLNALGVSGLRLAGMDGPGFTIAGTRMTTRNLD